MIEVLLQKAGSIDSEVGSFVFYESQTSDHGIMLDPGEQRELGMPSVIKLTLESADQ